MLLESVKKMLETMRKSFYELSKQDDSEPLMKNTQQVYAGFTYSNDGGSNEIFKRIQKTEDIKFEINKA